MGYAAFSQSDTVNWLELLITYEKGHGGVWAGVHTFPRGRASGVLPKSPFKLLKFYSNTSLLLLLLLKCVKYVCGVWKHKREGKTNDTEPSLTHIQCVHLIPRLCVKSNPDSISLLFLWPVSTSVPSPALQSDTVSSGFTLPLHKHKSLSACGNFIPEEMPWHLLCKGKITIVENMTAPSARVTCLAVHWSAVLIWILNTSVPVYPVLQRIQLSKYAILSGWSLTFYWKRFDVR